MRIEDIRTVGVAGAGSMGAGIAQVAAQSGFQVKVVDVSDAVWARARKTISGSLERMLKKEKITADQMKETLDRISFSADVNSLSGVPFVFEAVFEDVDVKKEFFGKLDAICGEETVYATNTSSISITEMAALVKRPAKFVGMHFFNPVPMMQLVEVIPAMQTEKATTELALAMSARLGRVAPDAAIMIGAAAPAVLVCARGWAVPCGPPSASAEPQPQAAKTSAAACESVPRPA